jgi:predicted dehydrogenase
MSVRAMSPAKAIGSRPVRVAVIGVGHLGQFHAKIYAANARAELVCVVDPSLERARALAEECKCDAYGDVGALPSSVEAVSIAVPTGLHAKVAVPLLERGVH